MGLKSVDIDEVLYNKVKERARKEGKSIRAVVEEVLSHYFKGDYVDDKAVSKWKEIAVKFPTKCVFCGKEVSKGEVAMWAKGVGVAHLSCFYAKMVDYTGDKTLARKYVKVKELEAVIRGLKEEADRLADVVLSAKAVHDINRFSKELRGLAEEFLKFLNEYSDNEDVLRKVEEIYDATVELRRLAIKILQILSKVKVIKVSTTVSSTKSSNEVSKEEESIYV